MKIRIFSLFLLINIFFSCVLCPFSVNGENDSLWEKISFFGDSTTYGLVRYIVKNDGHLGTPYTKLHRDQILTPSDGTFYLRNLPTTKIHYQGSDLPLAEAIAKASPEILIITVGVNGLPHWTQESFSELYRRLIRMVEKASPNTEIILQSIYPTAKVRERHLESFTVDKVDRLNGWIRTIAQEENLRYLDTAAQLKGNDGWLRPEYQNGDGLHLNTAGFNRVLEFIENNLK